MTAGGEPIHILDEIEFAPGQRAAFLAALEKRYRPQAEAIGLRLRSLWLDPPVDAADVASRALIDWELDGVAAFWSWRARGVANPDLAAFWSDAAPGIARRVRRYASEVGSLAATGLAPVAPVREAGRAQPVPGLIRSVSLLRLRPGVGDAQCAQLERALAGAAGDAVSSLGRNLPGTLNGGDYTWDLVGASASALVEGLAAPLRELISEHDEVALDPMGGGLRAPEIANGIKRTLLLRVLPGAAPSAVAEFERALLAMPEHIGAIRNWCLSRTHGSRKGWTHAWEQDFAELSDSPTTT